MTKKLLEQKLNNTGFDSKSLSFDKDKYAQRLLEDLVEKEAKKTEILKAIESGIFEIHKENLKSEKELKKLKELGILEISEKDELTGYFDSILDKKDKSKKEAAFYRKIISLITEMAENVIRYRYYLDEDKKLSKHKKYDKGEIDVIGDKDKITVSTFNYTEKNISRIPKRLEEINKMSKDQLKEETRRIQAMGFTEEGGAGLGFVNIKMKNSDGKFTRKIEKTENPKISKIFIKFFIPKKEIEEITGKEQKQEKISA